MSDQSLASMITDFEHRIGHIDDIPSGAGRTIAIESRRVAVFRPVDGRLYAVQAECPRHGGMLSDGSVEGTTVRCPARNHSFSLVRGGSVGHGSERLTIFPVRADVNGQMAILLSPEW